MEIILNMLLMAPQGQGAQQNGWWSFLPLLLIIVVFYFFFIRPQMKKQKEQKKYRESLAKGQKIFTIGGIHGKIVEIQDTTVIIEVEGQNRLKLEKSAVATDSQDQLTGEPAK